MNKALNDKKRLATSGANFARSRTVTDGTCKFPEVGAATANAVAVAAGPQPRPPPSPDQRRPLPRLARGAAPCAATLPRAASDSASASSCSCHLLLLLPLLPQNVLGCDVGSYAPNVAYIADDAKLECEVRSNKKEEEKMRCAALGAGGAAPGLGAQRRGRRACAALVVQP